MSQEHEPRVKRRLLAPAQLPEKGIHWSPSYRQKLIDLGRFPRPVKIGLGGRQGHIAFVEEEIDAYIDGLIAKRDAQEGSPLQARPDPEIATINEEAQHTRRRVGLPERRVELLQGSPEAKEDNRVGRPAQEVPPNVRRTP